MTDKHVLSRLAYEIALEAIGRDQVNTNPGSATDRALVYAQGTEDPAESIRLLFGGLGSFVGNIMSDSIGEDEARARISAFLASTFDATTSSPDTTLATEALEERQDKPEPHDYAQNALVWSTILHTLDRDPRTAIHATLTFIEDAVSPEDELLDLFIRTAGQLGRTLQHYLGQEGAQDYVHLALFQNDLDAPTDGTPEETEATS